MSCDMSCDGGCAHRPVHITNNFFVFRTFAVRPLVEAVGALKGYVTDGL